MDKIGQSLQLLAYFEPKYELFQQIWSERLGYGTMGDHLWRKYQEYPEVSHLFNRLDWNNQLILVQYLMGTHHVIQNATTVRDIIYLFGVTVWTYLCYSEYQKLLPDSKSWELSQESPHLWFLSLTESEQNKIIQWFYSHNTTV